jgi:hypothetical protein
LRHILAAFYRPRGGGGLAGGLRRRLTRRRPAEAGARSKGNEAMGD